MTSTSGFSCDPDPEHPGWRRWLLSDTTRYNEAVLGRMIARIEDDGHCRVRIHPGHMLSNNAGNVHGAATLGFVDVALFCALHLLNGIPAAGCVTLGLDTQFIGTGTIDRPLDAVIEVLRETRRLAFLRGTVEQGEVLVAAFSATIRKSSAGSDAAGTAP